MVLAEVGKRMSKSLKNYPNLSLATEKYGSDTLGLYLIMSPVVRGKPLRFNEAGVKGVARDFPPSVEQSPFLCRPTRSFQKGTRDCLGC